MILLLAKSFLRFVRRAPYSTFSVFLGVAVGVASVTGVHLLGASVNDSLDDLQPPHLRNATHVVTGNTLTVADYVQLRERWRAGQLPNVSMLLPMIEGRVGNVRVVATDWLSAGMAFTPDDASASGTQIRLGRALVQGMPQVAEGDVVQIGDQQIQVGGVVGGSELVGSGPVAFVDLSVGYPLLGRSADTLDTIIVRMESPLQTWSERLESLMPGLSAGLRLPATDVFAPLQIHELADEVVGLGLARAILFNLGALGSLSLLVALLLMYQTCLIWLGRQRQIYRRLNEIGVSRNLLAASFVSALLVIAALAIVCGLFAGLALARFLLADVGGGAVAMALALDATVIIKSTGSGLLVCALGGGFAWHREWHVPQQPRPWRAWTAVAVLAALAIAGMWQEESGLLGVFGAILIVSGLVAFATLPLLKWLKRRARALPGPLFLRLSTRETVWFAEDLAVAIAALALALGVSIGVGLMVDSFRREFVDMLDVRLSHDWFVTHSDRADLSELADDVVARHDGNVRVSLYGQQSLRVEGRPVSLQITDFDTFETARYGYPAPLGADEVIASERFMRAFDYAVGDSLLLAQKNFRIVAQFYDFGESDLRLLVQAAAAEELLGGPVVRDRLSIGALDDAPLRIDWLRNLPELRLQNQKQTRTLAINIFDRTFAITGALTALAMIVAAVALYNALAGFRLNQQATTQLLSVLGVNRWERLQMDLYRSLFVGGVALVLALPLGVWLGWVLCHMVNPRAFGWEIDLVLVPAALLTPLLTAFVAVMVAGTLGVPAERRERMA